ncbi:cis-2,3-dihydrobiphenyl-2,3-diol dehydrogenase [Rhodococcus opacus PD630]|uniref:oxidoreductase n=1 Tax=Rhodococcus opacus TaxID=37919 RepID=UPI00029CC2C4|nr:oxidoreductase [Rhodococcus opacus]AHK34541.1 putative oxidoreductase [Rhodococcus opacus PD630]EHI39566.1 cis-2,3-dihydrobiphenyl-2,3-diol dehydrogenase [Rhodococcus opacus PD630]UDG96677.1 SDR family NAD(P)-dependent oxidoreductase [Rhodococcus opacus PD630]
MTTWFITGASSGLGAALARAVLEHGDNAVITARNADHVQDLVAAHPNNALAVPLDVTDHDQVVATVSAGTDRFGGVDVLVNNAGHGYRAAVEEAAVDEVDELFATNFFGPVDLIKQVLPQMRSRRSGTIVNVSSIGAPRSNPASGYYTATKAALEGMSDALNREVAPLGIRVMVLEPGAFRTDFSGRSLNQSSTVIDDYADTAGKRRKENDHTHGTQQGDPDRAAQVIIAAVEGKDAPFRLLLGTDAIQIVREELQGRIDEIDEWAHVSATTDFAIEKDDE